MKCIGLTLLVLLAVFWWRAEAQEQKPLAPKPATRSEFLGGLIADPATKALLDEQIKKSGGNPPAVYAGKEAADPRQNVNDIWHQSVIVTPREPTVKVDSKEAANLVCYHVYMHNLVECLTGNYLYILSGNEGPNFSAVALLDFPKSEQEEAWLIEARYDAGGDTGRQIKLAFNHNPIPSALLADNSGRIGFVLTQGGQFFVELTRPPADEKMKLRRFYYFRLMKL